MLSDEAICAGALDGTPDESAAKLATLRDAGAAYVRLNSAGGPPRREFRRASVITVGGLATAQALA